MTFTLKLDLVTQVIGSNLFGSVFEKWNKLSLEKNRQHNFNIFTENALGNEEFNYLPTSLINHLITVLIYALLIALYYNKTDGLGNCKILAHSVEMERKSVSDVNSFPLPVLSLFSSFHLFKCFNVYLSSVNLIKNWPLEEK